MHVFKTDKNYVAIAVLFTIFNNGLNRYNSIPVHYVSVK